MTDRALQADVAMDALVMLDGALGTYASGATQALAAIRADFAHRCGALHVLEDDASRELDRLSDSCDSAEDDDDLESMLQELSEAKARLAEIRRWISTVEPQHASLGSRAGSCSEMLQRSVPRARAFLRDKIDQLQQYQAVRLEAFVPSQSVPVASPAPAGHGPEAALLSTGAPNTRDLRDRPLPRGFRWVPLSEISLEKELADVTGPQDFQKGVSYDAMRRGFASLRDEILPALDVDRDRRADYFLEVDRRSGREYAEGRLQSVYEAFFGQDYIYFVRRPDGSLDLINGRHRVKVANDLGWDAVPAQVRE